MIITILFMVIGLAMTSMPAKSVCFTCYDNKPGCQNPEGCLGYCDCVEGYCVPVETK